MASLQLDPYDHYLMPGIDSKHSQLFFTRMKPKMVELLADWDGSIPFFAVQPVHWYRGDGIKRMHCVLEVFIKKSFRSAWSPFMYSSLLAAFWGTWDLFGDKSLIHIQFLGPAKVVLGVTEAHWDLLKTVCRKLAINMGLSFKDVCIGEFSSSAEKGTPIPEHCNGDKLSTFYVPPMVGHI